MHIYIGLHKHVALQLCSSNFNCYFFNHIVIFFPPETLNSVKSLRYEGGEIVSEDRIKKALLAAVNDLHQNQSNGFMREISNSSHFYSTFSSVLALCCVFHDPACFDCPGAECL